MDFSKERLYLMKAIRLNCLDCSCWEETDVRECQIKYCPLYPYRMGRGSKLPVSKRKLSEITRVARKKGLEKA